MKAGAAAVWLLLSLAGAKLTDDRCDPTRERDDRACRAKGQSSKGQSICCACMGTGYCSDGFSYETGSPTDPAWACGPLGTCAPGTGPGYVTGCCYAPGSTEATYMDETDQLCLTMILYLALSATLGVLGCAWARRRGHCSGQIGADAPTAVPLTDIEASTIANPLLPEPDATPSAPPAAPEPEPAPSAPPWEPMFTDNEAFAYAKPEFLAPTDDDEGALPEGMAAEPGVGVGKPADDAPPAYLAQPALVPEGQPAEAVAEEPTAEAAAERIEPGDGCCQGCLASPHLKSLALTIFILFQLLPLPFCNATWLYQGECDDYWTMRNYAGKEEARDNALVFFIIIYVIECLAFSKTQRFLWNLKRESALKPHIELVKRSRPIIKLKIQCYHFETHHWWETVKDQHGRERRVRRQKEVRVNTHAASHAYQYSWVRDSVQIRFRAAVVSSVDLRTGT
jgi:hypothetical protein